MSAFAGIILLFPYIGIPWVRIIVILRAGLWTRLIVRFRLPTTKPGLYLVARMIDWNVLLVLKTPNSDGLDTLCIEKP